MASNSIRKAAVFLISIPKDQAKIILSRLDPKQIEVVMTEIAKIGLVTPEEQENVIREFSKANPAKLVGSVGGFSVATELAEAALGQDGLAVIDGVRSSLEAIPFGFLQKVDSENLLTFIIDEYPQTIALIVAHLRPSQAADIINGLPPERQLTVIRRIAAMQQTNPEIIKDVEKGLEIRMSSLMTQKLESAGGVGSVAEILNVIDRSTGRTIMENLAQDDPELVEEIRRLMFVFEDILKLTDKDIQEIQKNVESNQWAIALKGASEDLKQKIFKNMSKRAGKMLQEEMDFLGPMRSSDVERVQQEIVDVIRKLEDSGEVTVHSGKGGEEKFIQ
ncbi:MAG: flagellar motor switch protein FliG [Planctomycetaceae bacterium]|jgi:flagellar motor switch protein FliG|nr:flagellar motor switch protein FliG [Planctomycetaceae bacterium]